jgi:hypothetical protein
MQQDEIILMMREDHSFYYKLVKYSSLVIKLAEDEAYKQLWVNTTHINKISDNSLTNLLDKSLETIKHKCDCYQMNNETHTSFQIDIDFCLEFEQKTTQYERIIIYKKNYWKLINYYTLQFQLDFWIYCTTQNIAICIPQKAMSIIDDYLQELLINDKMIEKNEKMYSFIKSANRYIKNNSWVNVINKIH